MTTRKVITPIHHFTPLCNKFLGPLSKLKKFTRSEGRQASLLTITEEVPATRADDNVAEEMETHAAADDIAPEIPQPMAPVAIPQETVKTSTANLQPKPQNPHSKKRKFKAEDFFNEHIFFTDYNPYDAARRGRKRFWTASQMNFYSSLLFDKDKIFDHEQIPHVDMESLPCITPILSVLHDAGLLNFWADICNWNE